MLEEPVLVECKWCGALTHDLAAHVSCCPGRPGPRGRASTLPAFLEQS